MQMHTDVAERMQALEEEWQVTTDQRAVFLSCYSLMTRNTLVAVDAGEFGDCPWVYALLHRFAGYYFDALTAYEQDPAKTPAVWRLAFDAAHRPETYILQNLMLGINAHINYDLVLTLVDILEPEWTVLDAEGRGQRYRDHCQVNRIIAATIDSIQDGILEQNEPELDLVDKLFGRVDEWAAAQLITRWREEVWQNAVDLLESDSRGERERLRQAVESAALRRGDAIMLKGGPAALFELL